MNRPLQNLRQDARQAGQHSTPHVGCSFHFTREKKEKEEEKLFQVNDRPEPNVLPHSAKKSWIISMTRLINSCRPLLFLVDSTEILYFA